jgi:uncharacterized cupin superfamily protein
MDSITMNDGKDVQVGRIDVERATIRRGTAYPPPYDQPCRDRLRYQLGDAAGLTQFGVNRLHIPPGSWSSQRHWHGGEDEFVLVLAGEVVLVMDDREQLLRAGDAAGFPAGVPNGHHLQNRTTQEAVVLEVGSRRPANDPVDYPGIDLVLPTREAGYCHRDGRPYGTGK